jgi:hypothetical protein
MISKIKLGGIFEVETGEISESFKEVMNRMEEIFIFLKDYNFILAVDEFSDFLLNLRKNGIDEVRLFLEWLRRLRQEEKARLIINRIINRQKHKGQSRGTSLCRR